jgi:hypothetical protein
MIHVHGLGNLWIAFTPQLLAVEFSTRTLEELGFAIAGAMTGLGVLLQWQLPRQRMETEELIKDGKMTESEAKRRLRFFSICAPVATVAGIGMLIAVLMEFAE